MEFNFLKKIKIQPIHQLIYLLVGVLMITWLLWFWLKPTSAERFQTTQENLVQIYEADSDTAIRLDSTEKEMKNLNRHYQMLNPADKEKLREQVKEVNEQFEIIPLLSPIFAENPLDADKEVQIKPQISHEMLESTQQDLLTVENPYRDLAIEQIDKAQAIIDDIQHGRTHFNNYLAMEIITRENLSEAIAHVNKASKYIDTHQDQPYLQQAIPEYDKGMDKLVATILNAYQYGDFRSETMALIADTPMLNEGLKGTGLNPVPLIALTFDDGPNEEYTTQILDILANYSAKATFFAYGAYVDDNPEVAQRIVNEGHILANHSYSHPNFEDISDEDVLQQIDWTQESIYDETGYENKLYRMPFGAGGLRVVELLPNLTSIMWNLDSLDWKLQDAELIYNQVVENLSRDTLLLMHDTSQPSVDALAKLMPVLVDSGYEFVFPTELDFQGRYIE